MDLFSKLLDLLSGNNVWAHARKERSCRGGLWHGRIFVCHSSFAKSQKQGGIINKWVKELLTAKDADFAKITK